MLESKIISLKKDLAFFASLIEKMIEASIQGLKEKDVPMLNEILAVHEPKANKLENEIDEECIGLIATFQPKARDLRTILMVMRMNNDLERMGDHAENIAESSIFLAERPFVKPLVDIPRMASISIGMLKDAITSFIEENPKLAKDVCMRDNEVDDLHEQIIRELITFMSGEPATIERSLHLLRIGRNLERIADLSTNICEDTIFMVEGRVIKHHKK
jgi:phosphate transport system protein